MVLYLLNDSFVEETRINEIIWFPAEKLLFFFNLLSGRCNTIVNNYPTFHIERKVKNRKIWTKIQLQKIGHGIVWAENLPNPGTSPLDQSPCFPISASTPRLTPNCLVFLSGAPPLCPLLIASLHFWNEQWWLWQKSCHICWETALPVHLWM